MAKNVDGGPTTLLRDLEKKSFATRENAKLCAQVCRKFHGFLVELGGSDLSRSREFQRLFLLLVRRIFGDERPSTLFHVRTATCKYAACMHTERSNLIPTRCALHSSTANDDK